MDEEAPAGTAPTRSQRARLTCAECHRRKTKCDKNVPCIAHLCSREEVTQNSIREESEPTNNLVQILLQRVENLEKRLASVETLPQVHSNGPNTNVRPNVTVIDASPDVSTINTSPNIPENVVQEVISSSDPEACDTATVLEFLAWGRKKDVDFANDSEPYSGPGNAMNDMLTTDFLTESTNSALLDMLETLLPSRDIILKLVTYHNSSVLWYHGSYSSKILSDHLHSFLTELDGNIRHEKLNLQWLALLFAVMTGSLTCASQATRRGWGFSDLEATNLSLRWYDSTVTCLSMSNYLEIHTIHAVQAIATLTIAAHILGKSSSQSALLASAGRIAQSLGLHKLASETGSLKSDQLRKREAGRRVFVQLCTQDWFQIPFSDIYTHNPRFITTTKPLNCNDDDMIVHNSSTPTQASYCNFRYDIAALMPQLLDAMEGCNTLYTKYEQVMKYDAKMRELATASIPIFLSKNGPVAAGWPRYINWARRSLTICASHKIIMIHRKFVVLSFTNSAFVFTRRTCIAASKTILRDALAPLEDDAPVLWIDQAFAVAAGIILSLDALHRKAEEPEFAEHSQLVGDTIAYLREFKESKIAARGSQLLSALKNELNSFSAPNSRKRPRSSGDAGRFPPSKRRAIDVKELLKEVSHNLGVTTPAATPTPDLFGDVGDITWSNFADLLPAGTELFDAQYLFDDLFPPQL
ncbi:hypothetical protein DM02DRAFT_710092 [Periconia macrospinosa]|uniref:Zn(2)-C6 fungal-type domain-containing protein n=1 Tax=Periconia macrospinosa TaxID=97972 RepID=A0A2V1DNR5_9PLEO|nr:hypothetical protein DM02DRAFT_710092 [Periconia macrospinosa]